jgi:hypothetical protein
MKTPLCTFLLPLLVAPYIAAADADLSRWSEDFSDPAAFKARWHSYGWLPDGKVASGPDNMHRWWNIEEGVLKGQTFGKLHPSGLQRKVSGTDVRLRARFKLSEGGMAAIGFNGPNPILEANFHLAGVHIRQNQIRAWDEENLYAKGSPEAEALKKEKKMNRKFIGAAKTEKLELSANTWYDLVLEMQGRMITAHINGNKVLSYLTNAGDAPKETVQFAVGGNGSEVTDGWYADIRFEPLEH